MAFPITQLVPKQQFAILNIIVLKLPLDLPVTKMISDNLSRLVSFRGFTTVGNLHNVSFGPALYHKTLIFSTVGVKELNIYML